MKKSPGRPSAESVPQQRHVATLDDVARMTGYSTATVSRALNKSPRVAAKTRAAVEEAIRKLGYVPDHAARMLATSTSRTIGIVVPAIENMSYAIGINALQQRLRQFGYTLLISSSAYDLDLEFEEVQTMVGHGVDAIVLVGGVHRPEMIALLNARDIPYVVTWVVSGEHPCIGFDNRAAGQRMASHLLDLGHTDIAVIASLSSTNDRAAARVAGVLDAMVQRKLSLPDSHVIGGLGSIAEGKTAMRIILAMRKVPTAVICLNDALAFGAILEAKSQGLQLPEDLSIMGFDDLDFAAELSPSLTTIRVPSAEIGATAADFLLAQLDERQMPRLLEIPANLVVRGSTAPPGRSSAEPRSAKMAWTRPQ
jgi:LacI family transcriptional regulator